MGSVAGLDQENGCTTDQAGDRNPCQQVGIASIALRVFVTGSEQKNGG
jgi:hypothetical protein